MNTVFWTLTSMVLLALALPGCEQKPSPSASTAAPDPQLSTRGSIQVTAQLVEIPEGAIFKRDLYDYATVLKYKVLKVDRGEVKDDFIYVAQYNPFKPRRDAADARVKDIGGNLQSFENGQRHQMALEVPVEDHFMGGLVNKYFEQLKDLKDKAPPIYWAVWTNLAP